jgi:sensor histidine kinase YesM
MGIDVFKRLRERREKREQLLREERQAERAHQQQLLQHFLQSLETIQESATSQREADSKALMEVAKGMMAQASAFAEWIKCFQTSSQPTTSVVREEDEYAAEQMRLVESGFPADIAALPEEFRLAWALRNDPNLLGLNADQA